jgi:polyferredoxin
MFRTVSFEGVLISRAFCVLLCGLGAMTALAEQLRQHGPWLACTTDMILGQSSQLGLLASSVSSF